jgi:catecholate siderophore receptor
MAHRAKKINIPYPREVTSMLTRRTRGEKSARKREKAERRSPRYWVTVSTMGALVACSAFDSKVLVPAYAHGARDTSVVVRTQTRSQVPTYRFDIAPAPLQDVLDAFRALTGWQVGVKDGEIGTLTSPGVSGVHTAEAALKQILAGTGVVYRVTASETAMLEVSGPSASLDVTDDSGTVSSLKYTEPLRDVPQTITIIPETVIEQQGATTLRDVLRNVSGLTMTAGEGGAPAGDNLTLRGFSARNDIFVDGVRDLSPQARDPFNLQQVEVTKGPTSAFSGRGSTGGTINLVSKAPDLKAFYDFTAQFGTDRTKRVTGDVNVPLEALGWGEHVALRLNFMAHESGVAGRDVVEYQRWGVAPTLAVGLGTSTRLTLGYFKLNQDNISDYGIPWVPATNNVLKEFRDKPAPVPRDTFYGFRDRDHEELTSDIATVKIEHDFNDGLTLRNQLRFGHSTRDSIATPPRFASNDSTEINREMRSWLTDDTVWDNQTDLRASFSTWGLRHSVAGGLALSREENERRTRTAPNAKTTLFDPNPDDVYTGEIKEGDIVGEVVGKSAAAYAFDTVHIGEKVQLNGGLRFDYFDAEGIDLMDNEISRVDQLVSWRAGAVYKPAENGSVYAAYATSISPSLEGLSYGTADSRIDPEETYTFEVGTKWDVFRERISVSLAGFRVDKTNARTPALIPGGPPQVLDGRQRVIGAEFGLGGRLRREWTLTAAYTYLSSKILESNTGVAPSATPTLPDEGMSLQNTPKHSANIWTVYETPWRLTVGGGLRIVDDRFGNNANTRRVDGYYTIDAMASYPVTENIDLRLNLYNLNDAYYFDRLGGGHLIPGPSRSANIGVGFKF